MTGGRLRAVAILRGGGVRRFRSARQLETFMAREEYLVVNIGRSDRAAVEECQALQSMLISAMKGGIGKILPGVTTAH
ncbi:hypothetical protein LCGC14_0744430 [marine sediment metagenome]|uniref:Uncharacterized protein n=1 Tax=marine sediment metagenome TaxID=412755 RepID=A0A0F9TCZ0_9ZZZZ